MRVGRDMGRAERGEELRPEVGMRRTTDAHEWEENERG